MWSGSGNSLCIPPLLFHTETPMSSGFAGPPAGGFARAQPLGQARGRRPINKTGTPSGVPALLVAAMEILFAGDLRGRLGNAQVADHAVFAHFVDHQLKRGAAALRVEED